jgi:hypothetical protein
VERQHVAVETGERVEADDRAGDRGAVGGAGRAADARVGDGDLPVARLVPSSVQPGPQLVLPVPSTTELPNATTVPASVGFATSTALTRYVPPVVAVYAAPESSAVWSPEPAGLR